MTSSRAAWVAGGLIAGLAIAYLCPHEPTYATTADRDSQFMMVTVPVGNKAVGLDDPIDGVFILDFLNVKLNVDVIIRLHMRFNSLYMRNLAADFDVKGDEDPHYCIVSGASRKMPSGQRR